MTLTKEAIFQDVAKKGFSRKQSVELVEGLLEIIKAGLERGEDILISGFGKFYVRKKTEPAYNTLYPPVDSNYSGDCLKRPDGAS